jgi:hypothetical protein
MAFGSDTGGSVRNPASACVRTVFPRTGGRVWYDDQRDAHRQIYAGDGVVDYQFMGTDPNSSDNRWRRDAMRQQIPVIYFLGAPPGRYQAIIPTFIVGWHTERLTGSACARGDRGISLTTASRSVCSSGGNNRGR